MSRKSELTAERESYTSQINEHERTIVDSKLKIKFLTKRIKLIDEEISECPEEAVNSDNANTEEKREPAPGPNLQTK